MVGLSYDGDSFHKNLDWVPFLRGYWSEAGNEVCLAEVVDVVNESYENTLHTMVDGCVMSVTSLDAAAAIQVAPNPMGDFSTVTFPLGTWAMEVMDMQGRLVLQRSVTGRSVQLSKSDLGPGSYVLRFVNEQVSAVVRFEVK